MGSKYKTLIMGASYGSLLGTKLALAGHAVHLICLPAEAELINRARSRITISRPTGCRSRRFLSKRHWITMTW